MKIVNLKQNTPEWLVWKRFKYGASESAALFNESPYYTKREYWLYKKELIPEWFMDQDNEFIFKKGHASEEEMRKEYFLMTGIQFEPACVQHEVHDFIIASLDGLLENMSFEAKLVSKEVFEQIKRTRIPPRNHWIQIQHQFLAAKDVDICIYFARTLEGEAIICEVHPDEFFKEKLELELIEFHYSILNNQEPPMTKDDFHFSEDEEAFKELIRLKELKDDLDEKAEKADKDYKSMMMKIVQDSKHHNVASMTLRVKIKEVNRVGEVDFMSIPEVRQLKTEYLEGFRKASCTYTRVWFSKQKA